MNPQLLIDECCPDQFGRLLESAGLRCEWVREVCLSAPDPEVAGAARKLGCALLTEDRGFGRLHLEELPIRQTIIVIAMGRLSPQEKASSLLDAIETDPTILTNGLTILDPVNVRRRR